MWKQKDKEFLTKLTWCESSQTEVIFSMLKIEHVGTGEIFYATKESAGFDVCSNETTTLLPGQWALIQTGLRITKSDGAKKLVLDDAILTVIPELQLRPRSGLAAKFGITILNTPSTIDADYRGEIKVTLINHSQQNFEIQKGDRIAQAVGALVFQISGVSVKDVVRGEGGFGSTGA